MKVKHFLQNKTTGTEEKTFLKLLLQYFSEKLFCMLVLQHQNTKLTFLIG